MHPLTRPARRGAPVLAVVLALAATLVAIVSGSPPGAADPHAFTTPIFSADAQGDLVTIGNVATTCNPGYANANWSAAESAAACRGATSGATGLTDWAGRPMPPVNNRFDMEPVDVDGDAATFSSSSAELRLPAGAVVLWAGLHWNGATAVPDAAALYGSADQWPPADVARRFQVGLRAPGATGYTTIDAGTADGTTRDHWDDTNPGGTVSYAGFADITDVVRTAGPGRYTVADIQTCRGFGGCFGSWSITVAFADEDLPPRNLNVWHGWQLTSPSLNGGTQSFTVTGLTPPPRGAVSARLGVVQADGDRGLGPDSLELSSPSSPGWTPFAAIDRPLNPGEGDWFNSTVNAFGLRRPDADASPNLLANLDQDIALVEDHAVIGNADTSVSFRVRTAGTESLYSQVVHSAIDLYEPEIGVEKSVAPERVRAGDEVEWTVDVANRGIDPIRHAVVTDPLPPGLAYVPGSIRYVSGGPAALLGPKTDALGDDAADWDPARRTLTFRVGTGADGTGGGTMGLDPAPDGSHAVRIRFRTKVLLDPSAVATNAALARGEGRELADPFGPLETTDRDEASVATDPEADLGIAKDDDGAVVRAVGDRFTYRLTATNAGPSPATGVTMTDRLDPHLRFVGSDDGCQADAATVTCPVGGLARGATVTRTFEVEVVELPGPGRAIPNVASIDGNEPNVDCSDAAPEALCNEDDEETPQPAVDLAITKTDHDTVIARVGQRFTYELAVTNRGPDDATHVVIADDLDPRLRFRSSDRCAASGTRVRCDLGTVAAGATVRARIEVEVLRLPAVGSAIPNVATVHAAEPDPDCTPASPDAGCNRDDETTPRRRPDPPPPPPATPDEPAPVVGSLARTGTDVLPLVAGAGLALVLGASLVVARRLRAR